MARAHAPVGKPTRGTTNTNRLRRVDRWICAHPALRNTSNPLVVDLGYGASGVTAFELATRLRAHVPHVDVLGLEIDPQRVERAREQLAAVREGKTHFPATLAVSFARGGFDVPSPRPVNILRAFNVLRQYEETDVANAWRQMCGSLASDGVLVEGTCDEIGRVSSWIELTREAEPRSLTISLRLDDLEAPSIVAERLPKALIHRNVPGERVHAFLLDVDDGWNRNAALGAFSASQRWLATVAHLRASGWPLLPKTGRTKHGELSVQWSAVAPA